MVKLFLLAQKTFVYERYSLDLVKNEFFKKNKDFGFLWPRATRHTRLPHASERYFHKTSNHLFPLNNHYENVQAPINEAYICFFH